MLIAVFEDSSWCHDGDVKAGEEDDVAVYLAVPNGATDEQCTKRAYDWYIDQQD